MADKQMERRKQHLLFEQDSITPGKRAHALGKLFHSVAACDREQRSELYVPTEVLDAHGEVESHLRHLLAAASKARADKASQSTLRRVEKLLDSLPDSIMKTLPATPEQDWMHCYRDLVRLHDLIDDAGLCSDAEEYATIIEKMTRLAAAVSEASSVRVHAASMFTLWLMQAHLRRYKPRRRRFSRRSSRPDKRKRTHATHPRKNSEGSPGI